MQRMIGWLVVSVCLVTAKTWAATTCHVERLAENTKYETRLVILQSDVPGPTVYVVAGARGDGPAAVFAARQCEHFELQRGRLVIIPELNRPACLAGVRDMPGESSTASDLTQGCHPKGHGHEPANAIAKLLRRRLVQDLPDLLVELTEEDGFSGIRLTDPNNVIGQEVFRAMRQVTGCHDDPNHVSLTNDLIPGQLLQCAAEELHVLGIQIVTDSRATQKPYPRQDSLAGRIRLSRKTLEVVLCEQGMLAPSVCPCIVAQHANLIQVALYADYGARSSSGHSPEWLYHTLSVLDDMDVTLIGAGDIVEGYLDQFDVLYMGGGSSSRQGTYLGPEGREQVRTFIRRGGGYVGVCAGLFLALAYKEQYLGIVKGELLDPNNAYWKKGYPEIQLTYLGRELLERHGGPLGSDIAVSTYSGGPVLKPSDKGEVDYQILAMYHSDLEPKKETTHHLTEAPSVIQAHYGKGTLILFSCHPERPPGPQDWFYRTLKAAAGS